MNTAAFQMDALVMSIATAYQRLPFDVHQRLESTLAGDHNIAQAYDTAREIVGALNSDDLALLLARLLVTTDDATSAPLPQRHPAINCRQASRAEMSQRRRRSDAQQGGR